MRTRRLLLCAVIILVLASVSFAAQANPDMKARNIYQLFTKANPKLSAGTAKKYVELVQEAAKKYKQDSYVIAAMIVHESTVNARAVSKGGDYGLMQVRYRVHEKAIKKEYPNVKKASDFFDARTNIFFGTRILSECAAKSKNIQGALKLYSGGGNVLPKKVLKTVNELKAMEKSPAKPNTDNTSSKSKDKSGGFLDRLFRRSK